MRSRAEWTGMLINVVLNNCPTNCIYKIPGKLSTKLQSIINCAGILMKQFEEPVTLIKNNIAVLVLIDSGFGCGFGFNITTQRMNM